VGKRDLSSSVLFLGEHSIFYVSTRISLSFLSYLFLTATIAKKKKTQKTAITFYFYSNNLILNQPYEVATIIILLLQIRKLGPNKVQ
jgi:hypothetical protein